jgi:class 3 adenylate cyclase
METWQEKVKTLGINVKQVVRVFDNAADIANLENRISRYSSLPNVELGVLLSPALAPLLEVYIVRGQYAVLSFSTSAATPNSMTDSVVLDDKFAVQALERFFTETLWSSTEPLKTAFAVDDGVLAEMRRAVALVSETDKRVWRELPTLLARGGSIATDILHLISSLGDAAPALELQPAAKTMAGQIRDLTAAVRGMPAPGARYPNAFRAIDSVRPARSLEAVSLLDNEVYWMSPAGQSQMTLEAELCARGVSIRRVFIVPATSRLSTVMVEILRRQRGYAGDTSVVLIERNDAQLVVDGTLSDFAILDRAAVICDSGARVSRYSASEWVLTLSASFDLLFYEAGIRPQEIGSREVRRVATVVAVDTVSYSDAAALANEMLGQDALLMLDRQIQDLFSECLRGIGANVNASVLSRDGDGAKFVFDRPETAHAFAEAVHAAAARRNETRHDPRALRKFRIGAATGEIIVSASSEQKIDAAAGMAVTIAVRLEQAGEADTILIDDATYASLSAALQEYYGDEELVAGKRDEQFRVRRRRLEGQASRRAPDAQASQKLL